MTRSSTNEMAPLRECEADPAHPDAEVRLRHGLLSTDQRVVELAARLAGAQERKSLVDDLRQAYDRLLRNDGKQDPGCLAKTEIVDALRLLDYDDEEFFLAGIHYRQYEPRFGGSTDSAARLRALCGFALIQQSHPDAMSKLVDLLADPEKTARAGAARAIAHGGGPVGELLLRLKMSVGDAEAEVMGECFAGLLRLKPREAIKRVAPYLRDPAEDLACEAAVALGETRLPEALPYLQAQLQNNRSRDYRRSLLMAIGLLEIPEAVDLLFSLVAEDDYETAVAAIDALANCRDRKPIQKRLAELVSQSTNTRLKHAVATAFRAS